MPSIMLQPAISTYPLLPFFVIGIILLAIAYRLRMPRQFSVDVIVTLGALQALLMLRGSVSIPGPNALVPQQIAFVVLLLFGTNLVAQIVQWVFIESAVKNRLVNIPPYLVSIIGWAGTATVVLVAMNRLFGIELTAVYLGSTVASAVIGLSLQEILGSLFAGIVLQLESPFIIGDWVEVGGNEGVLESMGWRTVSLRTRLNYHIILTNSDIAGERIVNFSRPSSIQGVNTKITAAYPHPPGVVKAVLLEMLLSIDGVLNEPAPIILASGFGGSSMEYIMQYWIDDYGQRPFVEDQVYTYAWYALTRAGMGDPFGIADVNILSHQEDVRLATATLEEIYDELTKVAFLKGLSQAQLRSVANVSELHHYATGELLVREGEAGDSLFIIKQGVAGVYVESAEQQTGVRVAERREHEFFGEMSLLTGEPRSATVKADSEMQVIILGRDKFSKLVQSERELLELFATAAEQRQLVTAEQIALSDEHARQQATFHARFVQRIANFLGLS